MNQVLLNLKLWLLGNFTPKHNKLVKVFSRTIAVLEKHNQMIDEKVDGYEKVIERANYNCKLARAEQVQSEKTIAGLRNLLGMDEDVETSGVN